MAMWFLSWFAVSKWIQKLILRGSKWVLNGFVVSEWFPRGV